MKAQLLRFFDSRKSLVFGVGLMAEGTALTITTGQLWWVAELMLGALLLLRYDKLQNL